MLVKEADMGTGLMGINNSGKRVELGRSHNNVIKWDNLDD